MLTQSIRPMLLHKSDVPPEGDQYLHQLKLDGHRCLLHYVRGKGVTLYTRHETNCTYQYPELQIVLGPHVENAVLDGEMICLHQGKPSFEDVITRFLAKKENTIQRLAKTLPAHYVAFDLLFLNGQKVTNKPLTERLDMLADVVVPSNVISICPSHTDGAALFKSILDLKVSYPNSRTADGLQTHDQTTGSR